MAIAPTLLGPTNYDPYSGGIRAHSFDLFKVFLSRCFVQAIRYERLHWKHIDEQLNNWLVVVRQDFFRQRLVKLFLVFGQFKYVNDYVFEVLFNFIKFVVVHRNFSRVHLRFCLFYKTFLNLKGRGQHPFVLYVVFVAYPFPIVGCEIAAISVNAVMSPLNLPLDLGRIRMWEMPFLTLL